MLNPLRAVRVKIDRAKKHLADLEEAVTGFVSREPHNVLVEIEPLTGCEIYRFREREPIPDDWGAVIGDCVHNLRSALDLLAIALVQNGGGDTTDYTAFPIGSDETHFRNSAIKRITGASTAAIELVTKLKPYCGGNGTLYRLHRIDIADKHQMLIPIAAAHRDFSVRGDLTGPGMEHLPPSPWLSTEVVDRKVPLKDGDELIAFNRGTGDGFEDKTEFQFGFEIAFGQGQIFDGAAVIPTLRDLIGFTERVIENFASEIFKLSSW